MALDAAGKKTTRCSAGLEIGKHVSVLADWCGGDGGVLSSYIDRRARQHRSYPHVKILAEFEPPIKKKTKLVSIVDPTSGVFFLPEGFTPLTFTCEGYTEVVEVEGGRKEYPFRETCEGCPYQREFDPLELYNPNSIFS